MLQKLLLNLIEKNIGKYVRNLEMDSLDLALYNGRVELHALELNVDAVNAELERQATQAPNLAVPFRVVDGGFSHLEVDVPWTAFWKRPVIFRVKGLTISVAPLDHVVPESMDESYADRVRDARAKSIASANDYRHQTNALTQLAKEESNDKSGKKHSSSFLYRRAAENLQIEITDVHISLVGADARAGVVLESLRIFTTDEAGNEKFVVREVKDGNSFLHKSLVIRGLGAYMDDNTTAARSLAAIGEDEGEKDGQSSGDHNYILAPLSFLARLRIADGNVCVDYHKYLLESELSALSILLSKAQVELARKIQRQIKPALDRPRPLFPEYRPLKKLTRATAKDWWRYAYRCVGRLNGRGSWGEFGRAFQLRRKYLELYKRHAFAAECSWMAPLSEEESKSLAEIEGDRSISVQGLMTWRNLADARARKEMEKKDAKKVKPSLFGSLFTTSSAAKQDDEDESPIVLTTDEMKELETLTLQDAEMENSELSKDSKLCDLQFVLGSFTIHLTTGDMRPLSSLNMGKVATSFTANADGSFLFDLALRNLTIQDNITPHTLFPEVLSSQLGDESGEDHCFWMKLSKTKTGDQTLIVKLKPFEMVAPPLFVKEMVKFASIRTVTGPPKSLSEANPMLRQSLSGSVDLFYDASQGVDLSIADAKSTPHQESPKSSTDMSVALFDAWKAKTESNTQWTLDIDFAAPVIIVPENCSKPGANILVLNLGHLYLRYGDIQSSTRVKGWFTANPYPDKTVEAQYDFGAARISSLLFTVGTARNWKALARSPSDTNFESSRASPILAPISAQMDFGIEAHSSRPRLAMFFDLPVISGSLSASQVASFVSVSQTWQKLSAELSGAPQFSEQMESDGLSQVSVSTSGSQQMISATTKANNLLLLLERPETKVYPVIHLEMRLSRLSAELSTAAYRGVEANLVSVTASATTTSDGTAEIRLSMGWFWVLDHLENSFARAQRLLIHSALPPSTNETAEYDPRAELEKLGVFDDAFEGSSELADIVLRHSPRRKFGNEDPFVSQDFVSNDFGVETIVDAKFSSLCVNWNPYAVKDLVVFLENFGELLRVESKTERATTIITSGEFGKKQSEDQLQLISNEPASSACILLRVELKGIEMILRSALDDLPLFSLSMTATKSALVVAYGSETGAMARISVGNLQAVSSDLGQTCESYRAMVGVSPGRSESLLTVVYSEGQRAMRHENVDDTVESVGRIHLSPMRMVYIQSQVLALVNYTTEGILGALTAAAASSAAAAAVDIARAESGKKQFVIKATSFEVVVPEAAYSEKKMSCRTGELSATYDVLPSPGGGEARVVLKGVMMYGDGGQELLRSPSDLSLGVSLPAEGVGSAEDQAIRTTIGMGRAAFCLPSRQYSLLMSMLSKNFGDQKLYLRQEGTADDDDRSEVVVASPGEATLTHAGNEAVVNPRRIYTSLGLESLSLSLFNLDREDPLVTLTADETRINMDLLPEGGKLATGISLKNLECTDDRIKSIGREYRSLIYQENGIDGSASGSAMELEFETGDNRETMLDLKIGNPHLVFIPDAVSDILRFFTSESSEEAQVAAPHEMTRVSKVEVTANIETVETALEETTIEQVTSYSLRLETSSCCIVFVDLGSSSLIKQSESKEWFVESATETFVLQGALEFKANCDVNSANEIIKAESEFHGNHFEAYTAFGGSNDALQVLEPLTLSIYVNKTTTVDGVSEVSVRLASATPVDICASMKNIALLSAIAAGVSDSLAVARDDESLGLTDVAMTERDAQKIEKLANMLQGGGDESIGAISRATSFAESSVASTISRSSFSFKVALPEMNLCFVNDLQGLDDALFRAKVDNVVANASVDTGVNDHRMKGPYTAFTVNLNCSITSDYFDESSRLWKHLLLQPWEITLRAYRGMNSKLSARVPSTACDIESFGCHLTFTEQFLVSLASASHMWTLYSTATTAENVQSGRLRRAIAASAARTLITVLPYAIENHCGKDIRFAVLGGREIKHTCTNRTIEYFRFPQPKGKGSGGKRLYGQDRQTLNSLSIFVGDSVIRLDDVDSKITAGRQPHILPSNEVILTQVRKEGKTLIIHVASSVDIVNNCSFPINVYVETPRSLSRVSDVNSFVGKSQGRKSVRQSASVRRDGRMTKESPGLGVPIESLQDFYSEWSTFDKCTLNLSFSPDIDSATNLIGKERIQLQKSMFRDSAISFSSEVICLEAETAGLDRFVFQAKVTASLVDGVPFVEITLNPRAVIRNRIPLSISVRTPMPHTHSDNMHVQDNYTFHHLSQGQYLEVYTSGASLAVSLRCTDNPVAGNPTDWMEDGWVDLPLSPGPLIDKPVTVYLPFPSGDLFNSAPQRRGTEVVIADKLSPHWETFSDESKGIEQGIEVSSAMELGDAKEYLIGLRYYAVDHTGEVLFEEVPSYSQASARLSSSAPFRSSMGQSLALLGAYRSESHRGRVTLLPPPERQIRLLHLTMEGESGYTKSAPFIPKDVEICEGGVESTNIPWESGEPSGFFAYRRLIDQYQSEIHVIPAYVVYNGSKRYSVTVKQPDLGEVSVLPGKIAPLQYHPDRQLKVIIEYDEFEGRTKQLSVDTAGLILALVSLADGTTIGCVAVETVVGAADSRWVVKLGDLESSSPQITKRKEHSIFENDLLRFRIHWSVLEITLSESQQESTTLPTREVEGMLQKGLKYLPDRIIRETKEQPTGENSAHPICTVLFQRFTVDWQRVFKDIPNTSVTGRGRGSPERSQISAIVHKVQLRDATKDSKYPIVFDSMPEAYVLNLCIQTRGPFTAELIDVNLFDLKLSTTRDNKMKPVVLNLSEDFIWKLIDLSNRITDAASNFGGYNITLVPDEDHGGYVASISDHKTSFIEDESTYSPPSSSTLFLFEKVFVSPFSLILSFDRRPNKSRYDKKRNTRGANLMNYFTRRLKFKIDRAELKYKDFSVTDVRGGADRLLELLSTTYVSRTKFKLLSILSATSFRDWKYIASRSEGDDKYLEGDIMRVTGNLAGRSANYILKKAGAGLGDGIKLATSQMGDGFESAAGAVGVGALGSGVNSIVSGVGQGFGDTLSGIGSGAGKVLKGTGQGVGQVFGGVSGSVQHIGKGLGKGLQGDARGFRQSMSTGVTTLGRGTIDGVGSVVGGAADGVATLGKGLFSGVKSIGKGFGGAVTGKPKKRKDKDSK